MSYSEPLSYLNSLINFETRHDYAYRKSFGLETITGLCAALGDPQRAVLAVHIAGSKGKGSTAAYIASILRAAGLKTGLYTSPHLSSCRERIRVDGHPIGEDDLSRLVATVRDAAIRTGGEPPTYFEVLTAAALLYFREAAADIAVYETGLGGRLDATNVLAPLVSVVTPISLEHTDFLGDTLAKIAQEKAGIIKEGGVSVSAPQEKEAGGVIAAVARERRNRLVLVGRDVRVRTATATAGGSTFSVTGPGGAYEGLRTSLLGAHQVTNAATAVAAVGELVRAGFAISAEAVRDGIAAARWEGRLDVVGRRPLVLVDGAQNRASARALAAAVRQLFQYRNLILLLGVSRDKDVRGILDELLPLADTVIVTKARVPGRVLDPVALKEMIGTAREAILTGAVDEALDRARAIAGPDDLILVTGSLFVVGEARCYCEQTSPSLRGARYRTVPGDEAIS